MNENAIQSSTDPVANPIRGGNRWFVPLAGGIVLGIVLTAFTGWQMMPGMMLTIHESRYSDVDQTCQELRKAIEATGWNCPAIRDMNKAMAKHGIQFDRPVRIVELCKGEYAHDVLQDNPEVLTLMPCAFGVYQGQDDKVYISGMNTGLMGKMFGGTIAEVMGTRVARDEVAILSGIIHK